MNLAADAYSYSRVLRRPRTQDHESSHEYTGRRDVRLCVSIEHAVQRTRHERRNALM